MKNFSLSTLFCIVTAIVLIFGAREQYKQSMLVANFKRERSELEQTSRIYAKFLELYAHHKGRSDVMPVVDVLAPSSFETRREGFAITRIPETPTDAWIEDVQVAFRNFEILSFTDLSRIKPGETRLVTILFKDDRLIDVVTRSSENRSGAYRVECVDHNRDGAKELVVRYMPKSRANEPSATVVYYPTIKGFTTDPPQK